jgi:PEP-CTERM motif
LDTIPNIELYDPDLWTDEQAFLNVPGQVQIQSDFFMITAPTSLFALNGRHGSGSRDRGGFGHLPRIGDDVQPVPEPSTLVLAALGLAGLAAFARRHRK